MNIIFDILVIIIFALSIFSGYKKGFVKTVLNLCGGIICLVVAISLSQFVGNFINENYVAPAMENTVLSKVNAIASANEEGEPDIDKLIEDEPSEFVKILEALNIDAEAFKDKFEELKKSSAQNTVDATIEYIIKPVSETVSYIIAFILLLIVSSIVIAILTFLLDKIVKLPILRTANKFFGIIAGILFAILWVYIIAVIIEFAMPYIKNISSPVISAMDPSASMLFRYFYNCNPVLEIIKALF